MSRFAHILVFLLLSVSAQARTINITDAPYGANIAAADNSAAIQAAINALLVNLTQSDTPGRGGTIVVPGDGCFKIANTIGISVTVDFRAKIAIVGEGGRRAACILQTAAKPVFQLKTTSGNIRDFEMRNLQLYGGTIGLDLLGDAYNLFDDVVISNQSLYGISATNGGGLSQFRSIWMVNQIGNNVSITGGGLWFTNSLFGEASGGFEILSGNLLLEGSAIFNAQNKLNTAGVAGEGNALFRLKHGSIVIRGGAIAPSAAVNTLIYTDYPRDILIDGADLQLGSTNNLIANRYAHASPKPYPVLMVRAARVSSTNPSGLNMYNQLNTGSGSTIHAHSDALFDIGATEYVTTVPFFDPEFTAASKRNTISLRARPNQDIP